MKRRDFMKSGVFALSAIALPAGALAQGAGAAGAVGRVPRSVLFGNPMRAAGQLSPDGQWLSWIAPLEGVLNVWVAPLSEPAKARALTASTRRPIRSYFWSAGSTHVLYIQDKDGDENWHVYVVPVSGGEARDLTPIAGVSAQVEGLSRDFPTTMVVGLNDRDKSWHDLWRVSILNGERERILENSQEFSGFLVDHRLAPRIATKARPEGGFTLFRLDGARAEQWRVIPPEDELTTSPTSFTRDGQTLYMTSSVGRDRAALLEINWSSGAERVIAEHPKADIGSALTDPETRRVQAAVANYTQAEYIVLDQAIAPDLTLLKSRLPGEVYVMSRTRADDKWLVAATAAEQPGTYHLYDRKGGSITELFSTYPQLSGYRLAPMRSEIVKAQDGLDLVCYLTLPAGEGNVARPAKPLPMVLNVHGGPWARDTYGYDAEHQWLADRGVAVLSVNFRGSTGFGKAFTNAGDREWGGKMLTDLTDAVAWAVKERIADAGKVAIMGASYGGYAVLSALTFAPDVFCCGVDIVGVSNLETFQSTIPPYWKSFIEVLARRVGDPRTEAGRAFLRSRSPVHAASRIKKPLLIAQGVNDPRVVQAESDQIVNAMRTNGLPVTYVLYPDEGHGFAIPENNKAFVAIAEQFLGKQLGFAPEPIGKDFEGASFTVPEGASHIPGLDAALAARPPRR